MNSPKEPLHVYVVDDRKGVRQLAVASLEAFPDISIASTEFPTTTQMLATLEKDGIPDPDIILSDNDTGEDLTPREAADVIAMLIADGKNITSIIAQARGGSWKPGEDSQGRVLDAYERIKQLAESGSTQTLSAIGLRLNVPLGIHVLSYVAATRERTRGILVTGDAGQAVVHGHQSITTGKIALLAKPYRLAALHNLLRLLRQPIVDESVLAALNQAQVNPTGG